MRLRKSGFMSLSLPCHDRHFSLRCRRRYTKGPGPIRSPAHNNHANLRQAQAQKLGERVPRCTHLIFGTTANSVTNPPRYTQLERQEAATVSSPTPSSDPKNAARSLHTMAMMVPSRFPQLCSPDRTRHSSGRVGHHRTTQPSTPELNSYPRFLPEHLAHSSGFLFRPSPTVAPIQAH